MQEACEIARALLKKFDISVRVLDDLQTTVDNANAALTAIETSHGRPHDMSSTYTVNGNTHRAYIAAEKGLLRVVLRRNIAGAHTAELALQLADMEERYGARVQGNFIALNRVEARGMEFEGVPRVSTL